MTRELLLALQHGDSAFPSGSFAFSGGFEGLLEMGGRLDRENLGGHLRMVVRHRWATTERIAVAYAHRVSPDLQQMAAVDAELEASSVNEPLRVGSRRNGAAFISAHVRIATKGASELQDRVRNGATPGHLATAQGFLWRSLGLSEASAVAISGYGTVAGLVTAAVRLGQIGALAAQSILAEALDHVAEQAAQPVGDRQPMGAFTPLLEIAAVRHSSAHIRLFAT